MVQDNQYLAYSQSAENYKDMNSTLLPPFAGIIDATNLCNSKCIYCKYWKNKEEQCMTDEVIFRVIDEMAELGLPRLCFSGGEPLLRESISKLVKRASDNRINPWINTNGILLNQERANDLVDSGLKYFLLSIDSFDPDTYKYLRGVNLSNVLNALKAIKNSLHRGSDTRAAIVCVLTKLNLEHVLSVANYCIENDYRFIIEPYNHRARFRGGIEDILRFSEKDLSNIEGIIDQVKVMKIEKPSLIVNSIPFLENISNYLVYSKLPGTYRCLVGWTTINVFSDGAVRLCQHEDELGNVNKDSLKKIWKGQYYSQMRLKSYRCNCIGCWTAGHVDIFSALTLES